MVDSARRPDSSAPFPAVDPRRAELADMASPPHVRPTIVHPALQPGAGEPTRAWPIPGAEDPTRAVPVVPHTGEVAEPGDDGRTTAPMPQPPVDNRPTRPVGPITVAPESPWGRRTGSRFAVIEAVGQILETFGQPWQGIGYFSPPPRWVSSVTVKLTPQDAANVGMLATIGAGLVYAVTVTEGFFASIAGALTPTSVWEGIVLPRPPSA